MKQTKVIEPCPFCGNDKDFRFDETPHSDFSHFFVVCRGMFCEARGPFAESKQQAIWLWNERATKRPEGIRERTTYAIPGKRGRFVYSQSRITSAGISHRFLRLPRYFSSVHISDEEVAGLVEVQ